LAIATHLAQDTKFDASNFPLDVAEGDVQLLGWAGDYNGPRSSPAPKAPVLVSFNFDTSNFTLGVQLLEWARFLFYIRNVEKNYLPRKGQGKTDGLDKIT
jgi:hypothetical protein